MRCARCAAVAWSLGRSRGVTTGTCPRCDRGAASWPAYYGSHLCGCDGRPCAARTFLRCLDIGSCVPPSLCTGRGRFLCWLWCSRGCGGLFCGDCVEKADLSHYGFEEEVLACKACRGPVLLAVRPGRIPTTGGVIRLYGLNFGATSSLLKVQAGAYECSTFLWPTLRVAHCCRCLWSQHPLPGHRPQSSMRSFCACSQSTSNWCKGTASRHTCGSVSRAAWAVGTHWSLLATASNPPIAAPLIMMCHGYCGAHPCRPKACVSPCRAVASPLARSSVLRVLGGSAGSNDSCRPEFRSLSE